MVDRMSLEVVTGGVGRIGVIGDDSEIEVRLLFSKLAKSSLMLMFRMLIVCVITGQSRTREKFELLEKITAQQLRSVERVMPLVHRSAAFILVGGHVTTLLQKTSSEANALP